MPLFGIEIREQVGVEHPVVPWIVFWLRRAEPGGRVVEDFDLGGQRRTRQIPEQAELQRLGNSLSLLIRGICFAREIAHLVIAAGEGLSPDERERQLGAAACLLGRDQDVHLRVFAIHDIVQIRDLLAEIGLITQSAVEEHPKGFGL